MSVRYTIECLGEIMPVRGNALASDDDAEDRAEEDRILAELDGGNSWAWCGVRVRAWAGDVYGEDYLGACSYESEEDFRAGGYYEDMKLVALDDLRGKLMKANWEMTS